MTCNTILVVEDDADIRDMIVLALEAEGYQVTSAVNGKDGLNLLPSLARPCLVLLDLMMPVMNGWEFLQAKRQSDILAVIPVVIVSAFAEQAQREENVLGVLKKPIDLDALLKFVKQYCGPGGAPG